MGRGPSYSTFPHYVPEHDQTNMKGPNDLANAFLFFLLKITLFDDSRS